MSDPLSSLNLLLRQATAERDRALRALLLAQANTRAAQTQGQQLDKYRDGYHARWNGQFRQGSSAALAQCYQGFGQRLDQVIGMQHGQTAQAQARLDSAQSQVNQHEQRLRTVDKLLLRRQAQTSRCAQRQEQRDTDEAAQRAASHARAPAPPPLA